MGCQAVPSHSPFRPGTGAASEKCQAGAGATVESIYRAFTLPLSASRPNIRPNKPVPKRPTVSHLVSAQGPEQVSDQPKRDTVRQ
jgi:hypothetical protein